MYGQKHVHAYFPDVFYVSGVFYMPFFVMFILMWYNNLVFCGVYSTHKVFVDFEFFIFFLTCMYVVRACVCV